MPPGLYEVLTASCIDGTLCYQLHFVAGRFVMSQSLILPSTTDVELRSAPIEPSWIIEGHPMARNALLSRSEDGTASTIVWECTEGKFNWYYDFDETIRILEGSVVLENDTMPPTRYGEGDVILFTARMPDGTSRDTSGSSEP